MGVRDPEDLRSIQDNHSRSRPGLSAACTYMLATASSKLVP
jgi:hypothetical protein